MINHKEQVKKANLPKSAAYNVYSLKVKKQLTMQLSEFCAMVDITFGLNRSPFSTWFAIISRRIAFSPFVFG